METPPQVRLRRTPSAPDRLGAGFLPGDVIRRSLSSFRPPMFWDPPTPPNHATPPPAALTAR